VLVDGYISQSFKSRATEEYFFHLLKRNTIPTYKVLSYPGIESRFFVIDDIPPHILARPPSELHWVLDRSLVAMGTVVPQIMWSPSSIEDRAQFGGDAELQMPVFFEGVDGKLGLSLEAAASGRCDSLVNARQPSPLGQKSVTNIRITWLGYKEFKRQIQIRDETREHNPITIAKFAHQLGRSVDVFLKRRAQWRIGQGGIERGDIMIIGAVHVSAGSWVPILQLTRFIL
ncbi:hypothetical protein BJV74DRAFT_773696, partial [Russula compacta]